MSGEFDVPTGFRLLVARGIELLSRLDLGLPPWPLHLVGFGILAPPPVVPDPLIADPQTQLY